MAKKEKAVGGDRELGATEDEIRAAWRDALGLGKKVDPPRPKGVVTVAEIAAEEELCESNIRVRMRKAIAAGTMEKVTFYRYDIMGRLQPVPGYRPVMKDGDNDSTD